MSKASRDKGARGEREFCRLLTDEFGLPVGRNLGQARDAGNDIDLGPFQFEVKRREKLATLYGWMKQADDATYPGMTPVLAVRADNEGWLVVMHFRDWAALAREEIANPELGGGCINIKDQERYGGTD